MRFGQGSQRNVWESVSTDLRMNRRFCIVPRVRGVGGMVSFSHKLEEGLIRRGFEVSHDLNDPPYQAVLVVGGTRDLLGLWRARRLGIPVIQRLDGMNWLHRRTGFRLSGVRHFLRAEYGNLLLSVIRDRFARRVIYQSEFSRAWWERIRGKTRVASTVIYNGVNLEIFHPGGEEAPPDDRWRILMVEGSLMGGYEQGLQVAVQFVQTLANQLENDRSVNFPGLLEIMIVGRISEILRNQWNAEIQRSESHSQVQLNWAGVVPHLQIPAIDRSAHLLYASDIHPACPNSVIEALGCGLPVVAFDTGALSELVTPDAGCIVPYGGDPWKLDPPDVAALARASIGMLSDLERYRSGARRRAESAFGLDRMVEAYLEIMIEG